MTMGIYIALGVLAVAGTGTGAYLLWRSWRNRALARSLQMALFLVRVPKEISPSAGAATEHDFKAEVALSEQLFSNLSSLKAPYALEVAVPHVGEEIHFFLAVPRAMREVAMRQVQGLWSGASVAPVGDDYTVFNPDGVTVGAHLTLKDDFSLPIRTYRELGGDTFASILSGFTNINEVGEGAALQLLIRPAAEGTKKRLEEVGKHLRRGDSFKKAIGAETGLTAKDVVRALNPPEKEEERVIDDEAVKAVAAKAGKPLFEVNARIIASAASPLQANDILDGIIAGFNQFAGPGRNDFKFIKPRNPERLAYQFSFRQFDPGKTMILTSEEIASFYHFPISSTATPRVKWLKAKEAPPPANLSQDGTPLGENTFQGQTRSVYIADDDRRRHVYIVGQTGTGKSTFIANMIVHDIHEGKGVAVIDPHGELTEAVLGHIPESRSDDLIYFEPGDLWHPVGLNMLDYNPDRPEEKTFIVNEMQGIFNKLFPPETMGPMFEQYMRNALLLLMEDMATEPATLMEVPRVFTDPAYRARKLERIRNTVVVDFWQKEAVKAGGDASLANMTPYITSKFNNFISNDYVRPIIGQPKSAFNFREAMDSGKVLLVNLSKGKIGDINAGLLGMVLTGKILMAALSRVDIPDLEERRDFSLYIDEFQNFTTDSISTILSEARKYRLNLTMAHQFIAQLTEKIRDAVFGNVGSQVVFRVGVQDAEFLVKQFAPVFSESDLVNIDNFNAYVRMLVKGETTKPFNIRTMPLKAGDRELADRLRERSRGKYGAPRQDVEDAIYKRLRE